MDCDLSDFFERRGRYWVMVNKATGEGFPVLYCPLCGTRIDYDEEKEEKE